MFLKEEQMREIETLDYSSKVRGVKIFFDDFIAERCVEEEGGRETLMRWWVEAEGEVDWGEVHVSWCVGAERI